jgi:hypothetical protein
VENITVIKVRQRQMDAKLEEVLAHLKAGDVVEHSEDILKIAPFLSMEDLEAFEVKLNQDHAFMDSVVRIKT